MAWSRRGRSESVIPESVWWIVEHYVDHPRHTVYVNIGTAPIWDGNRATQIDLDLDVVRNLDGSVEVRDEDEFSDRQTRFGYPPDLVADAQKAAATAVELLERGAEPFDSAADLWFDRITRR